MGGDFAPPRFLTEVVFVDLETAGACFGAAFFVAVLSTDAFLDASGLTARAAPAGRAAALALADDARLPATGGTGSGCGAAA
ncbi:hypothetical protein LMG918_00975, partial [Xanthomonas euvesicatoria]